MLARKQAEERRSLNAFTQALQVTFQTLYHPASAPQACWAHIPPNSFFALIVPLHWPIPFVFFIFNYGSW